MATNPTADNSNVKISSEIKPDSEKIVIPVIEENLQVGKRTVEQGGVRVRSRIIEKPVEETV